MSWYWYATIYLVLGFVIGGCVVALARENQETVRIRGVLIVAFFWLPLLFAFLGDQIYKAIKP